MGNGEWLVVDEDTFQSPSGDSLFSDPSHKILVERVQKLFQSPSGDSLFSDK